MTRIWTGTADVVSGYTTVVLTGDPLTAANCPADATIVLAGATYFVAESDYPTMTVELTRAYEAGDGTVSAEIDPMTPVTSSVVALAQDITNYNARVALLEAYGKGLFYTILGQTGANDPGPGKVARNAAAWADVTALYLDVLDAGGFDATPLIDLWEEGTVLVVRSLATSGYASYRVVAAPTSEDGNAWRLLASLDYLGGDGALADGEDVAIEWNRLTNGGMDADASVAGLADLAAFGGQASGFRVLVADVGDGRAALYTLDTSGSPEEWVGPAYVTGPIGEGLAYDAHVATMADREAYEVEAPGFSVLVDDVGDGRAGFFTLISSGSPSDWSGPAYLTGPVGVPGPAGPTGPGNVGRQEFWIDAAAMSPRATSGAEETTYDSGSNDVTIRVLAFDTTTQEYAHFAFGMPKGWDEGTVTFIPYWTNTGGSSTQTVVFSLSGRALGNDDAINGTFGTAQTSSDTWLAQNDVHIGPESDAITIGNSPAENDLVIFEISRVVSSDNMSGDALLLGIKLVVTFDAATDA